MKRAVLGVLCLAFVTSLLACSSSSSTSPSAFTKPFNFAGNWKLTMTVVEDPVGWSADDRDAPLGTSYTNNYVITTAGNAITLNDLTFWVHEFLYGTCDPDAGTATARYILNGGYIITDISLQATSDTTMTGTWVSDEKPSPGFPSGKHMKCTVAAVRS